MTDSIRIAAWNVNSLKVRLPHVLRWLQDQENKKQPIDALCLQELKLIDDKYPHQELEAAGYLSIAAGQKTYNGVAIIVRKAALAAKMLQDGDKEVYDALNARFEKAVLQAALEVTRGRRVEAAQRLGIGRNTITRKLQELGIDD